MESFHADTVNSLTLSGAAEISQQFHLCWIEAAQPENSDSLTYTFHRHTFFEIHFVLQGTVSYGFRTTQFTVNSGEYIIIPPLQDHKVAGHSDNFAKLTLALDAVAGSDTERSLLQLASQRRSISPARMPVLLEDILHLSAQKGTYQNTQIYLSLCSIVCLIAAGAETHSPKTGRDFPGYERYQKAKLFILDNPNLFLTCEEVSQYCGLSAKQLGRLFRKYEGTGLLEFLHLAKCSEAKRLLTETELSQTAIARALGFSDVRYFSRFFRRGTGMLPTEYRKAASP